MRASALRSWPPRCFSAGAAAQVTVLSHATLIDGTGAPAQRDVTIVIENGRIRDIGLGGGRCPANAAVVDLSGKFVVPGIINGPRPCRTAAARSAIAPIRAYGVTTTTSMYFDQDDIVEFKARQKAGTCGARAS